MPRDPIAALLAAFALAAAACGERDHLVGGPPDAAGTGGPDAPPGFTPDAAPLADARGPDAAPTADATIDEGYLQLTWIFQREGVIPPEISCEEMDVDRAFVSIESTAPGGPVFTRDEPCDDHLINSIDLPSGFYDIRIEFRRDEPGGGTTTRALAAEENVEIRFHEITFTPVVFRLFNEPELQMNDMADEAADFYALSPVPHTFPTGTPFTAPPIGACCSSEDYICAPDPSLWTSPPFSDLDFDVTGLSRYAYTFTSSGSGAGATFTITATA